jgi:uncharacterized membrane protein YfcA
VPLDQLGQFLWEPAGLSAAAFLGLVGASVVTSAITASVGMGGGLVMLALLGNLLPAAAVIPVHGVIQLGSNVSRCTVFRRHVIWPWFAVFAAGAIAGTALGASVVFRLPSPLLKGILGAFILFAAWRPQVGISVARPWVLAPLGAMASFLTMFLGATGPFVAAGLAPLVPQRHRLIGTHAAMMTLQHGLKVAAFGTLGFAFAPWLPLIVAMIVAGFTGVLVGRRLLDRLPERGFRIAFRALLTVLALRLVYAALSAPAV